MKALILEVLGIISGASISYLVINLYLNLKDR